MKYRSGEEIRKGDRVLFHRNEAEIALVCDPNERNAETAWHVKEFGGGVLISDPTASGRTFIRESSLEEHEDLEFVSREKTS
jgi:hypothetical protein